MFRRGGEVYVLCSRPNLHKHIEILKHKGESAIVPWQVLIVTNPIFGENQIYAYTYDKIKTQIRDIIENIYKYKEIYDDLEDDHSKSIFERMLEYRLTYNWKCNLNIGTKYNHYFDADVYDISNVKIFVDCGGYTGDTLEIFRDISHDVFNKYYLFEPDERLIEIAKKKGNEKCVYINKGVWSENTVLYFKQETANGNGTIVIKNSENSNCISMPVVSIDSMNISPDIIKMDVEGSELEALEGAKETIISTLPILAICVYHKFDDYRVLYDKMTSFSKNYRIYLRAQYNNIDTETYYLYVPKKEGK